MGAQGITTRPGRARVARGLAALAALIAAVPMFGLIDLGTLFGLADPQYVWAVPLEASWGSLFSFGIGLAFAWLAVRPQQPWPAITQLAAVTLALVLAAGLGRDPGPLWIALGVAGLAAAVVAGLGPLPGPVWPRSSRRSPAALVGLAGIGGWTAYTWLTLFSPEATEPVWTNGLDHWPVQVALGLVLIAGSALPVLGIGWFGLWRWTLVLSAGLVGVASLAFDDRAGALPHYLWPVGLTLWALVAALAIPTHHPRSPEPARHTTAAWSAR